MKDVLGGKGAGLAEMSRAGVPVPPGFTISTEVCNIYFQNGNKVPKEINDQILTALAKLESQIGKKLGDPPIRCWSASAPARSSPCRA